MKLWVRLVLVMSFVSVIPLLITGLGATSVSTRAAKRTSAQILQREAQSHGENISRWVDDQTASLEGWLRPFSVMTLDKDHQTGLLRAMYLAMPSVATLVLVDENREMIVDPVYLGQGDLDSTSDWPRGVGSPERAIKLVKQLPVAGELQADFVQIGVPYFVEDADSPSIPVLVRDPYGSSIVLGAELLLPAAQEFRRQSDKEHALALLDAGGRALVGGEHPLIDVSLLKPLLLTTAVFSHIAADHVAVQGAVAPVKSTDWSVVVVDPTAVVERPAREIRRGTLYVLIISILTALGVGLIFARSLSYPVTRLRDSALAVAEGDYGHTLEINGKDEIGDLGRAFNHMSDRLLSNQEKIAVQRSEIEAFNRELQQRVEDRTKELKDAQAQLVRSGQLAAVAEVGAGLAHELNNPLAGILGLAQFLKAQTSDEKQVGLLSDLETQASRCRDVVAAMLRFSSEEVGGSEKGGKADIVGLLSETTNLLQGPFRQKSIQVELPTDTAPILVGINSAHGSRIFAQILNTLRAGLSHGTTLKIRYEVASGVVSIYFESGQAGRSTETRDDWMAAGMGLWVARRLLDQLGGGLEAVPGQASAWRVWLPEG